MTVTIKNYQERETHRGLAYTADIWLENAKMGSLENPGDGSYTRVCVTGDKEVFHQKMKEHFDQLGWDTSDKQEYALHYTFAEHLLDIHEGGKVGKEYIEMGVLS